MPPTGSRTIEPRTVRLAAEEQARQVDAVAADVVQRSAAGLADVADVGRVVVEVAEPALDRASACRCGPAATSSRTCRHDGWRRYMNASARSTPSCSHASTMLRRLSRAHGQRLLAQHVLAGPRRGRSSTRGAVVGQRDVHRVDFGVGEELLVRAVDVRAMRQLRRRIQSRAPARVTRRRRRALGAPRVGWPARPSAADVGGRQDPPAQLSPSADCRAVITLQTSASVGRP